MREKSPLVSIIMPAYNCEAFIEQAIASVLQQTYTNWELLVADDGSTDNTRAVIDAVKDERIVKTHNDTNQGNIRTRNRLFDQAQGDFITVVDADDWIHERKVECQVEVLSENKALCACVTNYYTVNVEGNNKVKQNIEHNFLLTIAELESVPMFHPASIMLRREVYKKVGGLNLYFDRLYGEDLYWIYLIAEKYKVLYVAQPLYYYRANPVSLTNDIEDERKLTVISLVKELIKQRKHTGEDWLSKGEVAEAANFENQLIKEKKWLGEKYRIYAARQIDLLELKKASKYLLKATLLNPLNVKNARTLSYLVRSFYNNRRKVC